MKALSLTQPWATLVAVGAKHIETRSWSTSVRGTLAIHAAKGWPQWARATCYEAPFAATLKAQGHHWTANGMNLPIGAIVAVVTLGHVERIDMLTTLPDEPERSFGDYTPGRFMWHLLNIRPLPTPVTCRGALGLWDVPSGIESNVRGMLL